MCMLCVVPPHVLPERDKLEASALNNPHGFGFAIVIPKERRILVEHTMNADKAINDFLARRAQYPEGYALWHARFATHGVKDLSNCHPFRVGNDKRTVLAHNGILPVLEDKSNHRSDTRIFAEDILPKMGGVAALDDPQLYNVIEDFTSGSKLCILTVDPVAEFQCYIVHENKGWFDANKVWWSNDTCYLQETNWYNYGSSNYYTNKTLKELTDIYGDDALDVDFTCYSCASELNLEDTWYSDMLCKYCGACQDCMMEAEKCVCYNPSQKEGSKSVDYTPKWGKLDY